MNKGFVSRFESIKLAEDALSEEKERLLSDFVSAYEVVWFTCWRDTNSDDMIFGYFLSKTEAFSKNENIQPVDTKTIVWAEFQLLIKAL